MTCTRRRSVQADDWGKPTLNEFGVPICRWCRAMVVPPRRTFCSEACVHEWKIRSSPSYVRSLIWKRDRGMCRQCGIDVGAMERRWRRERRQVHGGAAYRAWRARRPRWEADHIVPVAEGGGECGLENYRVLCRSCHVALTTEWRSRRRMAASESMTLETAASHFAEAS